MTDLITKQPSTRVFQFVPLVLISSIIYANKSPPAGPTIHLYPAWFRLTQKGKVCHFVVKGCQSIKGQGSNLTLTKLFVVNLEFYNLYVCFFQQNPEASEMKSNNENIIFFGNFKSFLCNFRCLSPSFPQDFIYRLTVCSKEFFALSSCNSMVPKPGNFVIFFQ